MSRDRIVKIVAFALVVAMVAAFAVAAPRANPRKGKVFYKNNCRVCHDGSTDAAELSPITKTMEQWGRAFAEDGIVPKACVKRVKDKVGTDLTAQDLLDIQSYLVQHAADSDQPATCGN